MLGWRVIPRIGFDRFSISPHGLGIAIGYFLGALFMAKRARERDVDEKYVWDMATLGVVGAIVGARIAYVMGNLEQFNSPIEYFQIWRGGISLIGGLLGAFVLGAIYCRSKKISFWQMGDLAAPGLAIGVVIGRIGDLVIGDHLGKPTSGWWGWKYVGGELISPPRCFTPEDLPVYPSLSGCIEPGMVVHQTALYDMVWSVVILGILLLLERKPRRIGFTFLTWSALYAVGRIATDFARVDKHWFGLGLTGSQLTSIVALLFVLGLLVRYRGAPPSAAVVPPVEAAAPIEEEMAEVVASQEEVSTSPTEKSASFDREPWDTPAPPPPPLLTRLADAEEIEDTEPPPSMLIDPSADDEAIDTEPPPPPQPDSSEAFAPDVPPEEPEFGEPAEQTHIPADEISDVRESPPSEDHAEEREAPPEESPPATSEIATQGVLDLETDDEPETERDASDSREEEKRSET